MCPLRQRRLRFLSLCQTTRTVVLDVEVASLAEVCITKELNVFEGVCSVVVFAYSIAYCIVLVVPYKH